MDAESANVLGTVLNAAGMAMGLVSMAVSGGVYYLSRAGKVRAFENRVYEQLTNAASRIERVESQWAEQRTFVTATVDEMVTITEKTAKERRRLYAENQRAAADPNANGDAQVDLSQLPREEVLRRVAASMRGG